MIAIPLPKLASSASAKRPRILPLLAFLLLLVGLALEGPVSGHVRATKLLLRFSDPAAKEPESVKEEVLDFTAPRATVRARLFTPVGVSSAPAVVLVHGVHRKGIDEPRLLRFSRALAEAGMIVLTPEVSELSDYQVDARSIATVGAAMEALAKRTGRPKVGVMGMSFGGGIALMTAADARFRDLASFVVAVGAHDDMERVMRFFAGAPAVDPAGSASTVKAHDYGAMVFVYARAAEFFPAADVPAARESLKLWLWDEHDRAKEEMKKLSPASRTRVEEMCAGKLDQLRPEMLRVIDVHREDLATVSPRGHLADIRARVYLLHGAGDSVIPATETLWLARDTPRDRLRSVVVSPAIMHVELQGEPTAAQKWELVHFMGQVLEDTD